MLEKSKILYKGDMIAASFYVFVGFILLLFASVLHYYTTSLGYKYLSYGFFMFFLYCIGKGSVMYYISSKRHAFYQSITMIDAKILKSEVDYTTYRIEKKNINRRRYIWIMIFCSLVAFIGIFLPQKAILMGTSIPIALISGIELSIGLLTEFRLREFLRILNKEKQG